MNEIEVLQASEVVRASSQSARQQLAMVRQLAGALERVLDNQDAVAKEVNEIKSEQAIMKSKFERVLDIADNHWTLADWIKWHRRSLPQEALKTEGGRIRKICDQLGIPPHPKTIWNGGEFRARQWPIEAIRVWWPQCCRRYGWDVTWNTR